MRRLLIVVFALTGVLLLSACPSQDTKAPAVETDENGSASFRKVGDERPRQPVDTHIYVITGKVVAAPSSLVRQTEPGTASISGYNGYVSGTAVGPRFAGKGFVRINVLSMEPDASFASTGDVVLVKTSDTKAAALVADDVVQFKCRAQFEAIAPTQENERFDKERHGTWEFDFCRLTSPDIGGN